MAVDYATPPNVYVTGTTQSKNFPVNGANAAYQTKLAADVADNPAASNAFLSVITEIPATGMAKLVYSTILGGTQTDTGQGVAVASPTVVYVTGTTSSWNFPWKDNLQPFNGTADAFIAKMDPQVAGPASFIYATPLGGTAPPGATVNAAGNSIVIGGMGLVYLGGKTTAADFPTAVSTAGTVNGFQAFCASCAASAARSGCIRGGNRRERGANGAERVFQYAESNLSRVRGGNSGEWAATRGGVQWRGSSLEYCELHDHRSEQPGFFVGGGARRVYGGGQSGGSACVHIRVRASLRRWLGRKGRW